MILMEIVENILNNGGNQSPTENTMMQSQNFDLNVPRTTQELDRAIEQYRTSDLQGEDLYLHWRVIRDASLQQGTPESTFDRIPGEDSY